MSWFGKVWYLFLFVIYGFIIGLITTSSMNVVLDRIFNIELPMEMTIFLFAVMILGIHLFRVVLSLERTDRVLETEKEAGFWNWETNFQFYGMLWIIFVVVGSAPFLFIK
jgi:hypothetical protein